MVLSAEIRAGRFRNDLFYRIEVVPLRVPAMRERQDDIYLLVDHFMRQLAWQCARAEELYRQSRDSFKKYFYYN